MTIPPPTGSGDPRATSPKDTGRPPTCTSCRSCIDPRKPYLDAVARWESDYRRHHVEQTNVACGVGSKDELAAAQRDLDDAAADVELEKQKLVTTTFDQLRILVQDDAGKNALLILILDILRPALEPLSDRVHNLEVVVTKRCRTRRAGVCK